MNHRLVYVIGPSGAGKDSVLGKLREAWPAHDPAHWATRTITRPADAGGEQHEAVNAHTFHQLCQTQAFAMHWTANGLSYGVRHEELKQLSAGQWVFVNGSRAYLTDFLQQWPQATVVQISASIEVLAKRLAARGRETQEAIALRLSRAVPLQLAPDAVSIVNDGDLNDAANALRESLLMRDGRQRGSSGPMRRQNQPQPQ
ncbi:MAG: phosphonate metabolism protein/1,5-bisphosphokinase (PRPP-forming) PhnN [Ottowia sp.]|uniref:phosphonate metabolism protein/1,5-bisphosphokinase (PRPP-forming) PhnN n=1 Tax=Ottowia sp. TaxID=1898956 RepID=UPI003C782440